MNTDLLPFSAFALESVGPAAPIQGEGKTLTLQPARAARQPSGQAMSGRASANQSLAFSVELLRVAVVPADEQPMTITFPVC